ncbi:hypothetical protein C8Q75DRAFT_806540 [Abortiporus biennis]|nr:hypothetical protein C8Q75DRAFT_806540 [Abortiporus biennis]
MSSSPPLTQSVLPDTYHCAQKTDTIRTGVRYGSKTMFEEKELDTRSDTFSTKSTVSSAQNAEDAIDMMDRWASCCGNMKEFDETVVRGWKEDIDSLLVFAGLFSAVVTAFNIELYRQLQYDSSPTTLLLLQQISFQLAAMNGQPVPPNFSIRDFTIDSSTFRPSVQAVAINTTWFAALVCSLISALIGILAKQWLREYTSEVTSSPRETVRLRQFRYDGLTKWKVGEIIGFLPILLEIALVLFLHGLLQLLWSLHRTVASVTTTLVAITLVFYLITMILPAFSIRSPFKSPQSWAFCLAIWKLQRLRNFLWTWLRRPFPFINRSFNNKKFYLHNFLSVTETSTNSSDVSGYFTVASNWKEREIKLVRQMADELDKRALARTYRHSLDEDLLDTITPCLNELQPSAAATVVFEVIAKRAECSIRTLLDSIREIGPKGQRLVLERFMLRAGERGTNRLIHMLLDVLPRMIRYSDFTTYGPLSNLSPSAPHSPQINRTYTPEKIEITAVDILMILRKLLPETERAICEIAVHRRALDTLAQLLIETGAYRIQKLVMQILWEMTQLGCNMDYCPEGIRNVISCGKDAYLRNDHESFIQTCSILLSRLPSLQSPLECLEQWPNQEWLRSWLKDVESYFRTHNRVYVKYDERFNTKWCSGLAAVANKERTLIFPALVHALDEGVQKGLLECDLEEGNALSHLKDIYCNTSTLGVETEDEVEESDMEDFKRIPKIYIVEAVHKTSID